MDIGKLIDAIETIADLKSSGHFTIMRITTGYVIMLGTPSLDVKWRSKEMPGFKNYTNLEQALRELIISKNVMDE